MNKQPNTNMREQLTHYIRENVPSAYDAYTICIKAASHGYLDCLQNAHEHGYEWNECTCESAAEHGHLDCLRYAHEHGCPWDDSTTYMAALSGHLNCLQYAHEHGCPWDNSVCSIAAENCDIACLKYAHDHGCPLEIFGCIWAIENGYTDCIAYIMDNKHTLTNDELLRIDKVIADESRLEHLLLNDPSQLYPTFDRDECFDGDEV